jgi:hypothetical protein
MGSLSAKCYINVESQDPQIVRPPYYGTQKNKPRLETDPTQFISVPHLQMFAEKHDPNDPYVSALFAYGMSQRSGERISGLFRLDMDLSFTNY